MKSETWIRAILPLVCLGALSLPILPPAVAQDEQEPEYPHGDYSEDCELCHQASGWRRVQISDQFEHGKRGFPLLGAHGSATCRACHASLEFSVADSDCVSCHMDIHQGELGVDCRRCHTSESFIDRAWMRRAHVTTLFPLRGAHLPLDCEDCHPPVPQGKNQYTLTPVDCEACHLDLYLATTNPDHQAIGFPADCAQCHTTITWNFGGGRGFDHDGLYFPIYSGKHAGKWTTCNDCHTVPSSFASFTCLQCHPHSDQNQVDGAHSGVSGYTYDSQACLACHPRGTT